MFTYDYLNREEYTKEIRTSGDVVSYLMILMNHMTANKLIEYNSGIYRSMQFIERNKLTQEHSHLPEEVSKFLKIWNSSVGSYTVYDNRKPHDIMEIESYIHITSPIRRLVDLLNMMKLQMGMKSYEYKEESKEIFLQFFDELL